MNSVERILQDEITRLLDRIATSVPEGSLERAKAAHPTLDARLESADQALATARTAILEGYGRWRRALEDIENLWALAAWRSAAAEEPGEQTTRIAA